MFNQPRYKTYAEDAFFPRWRQRAAASAAHRRARPRQCGHGVFRGQDDGRKLVEAIPQPVTRAMLDRGRERFDIYCAVCHGRTGEGNGMIVQRGFPAPPSYHTDRLRTAPIGHFYDVITNGYGVMYSYAARVEPPDRWAIAAYIRALQLSRTRGPTTCPASERGRLAGR